MRLIYNSYLILDNILYTQKIYSELLNWIKFSFIIDDLVTEFIFDNIKQFKCF